jgi:hypothetical protein
VLDDVRHAYGFTGAASRLTTGWLDNDKLAKSTVSTIGLTLQHVNTRVMLDDADAVVHCCPWSTTACRAVCTLNNGNGRYDSVVRARRARTAFFATDPHDAVTVLAYELAANVRRYGRTLARLDVNSDCVWWQVLPTLTRSARGRLAPVLSELTNYAYSKNPAVLAGDGWQGPRFRTAFSWSERSDPHAVSDFIGRGGAVAVVTSRRKGAPVIDRARLPFDTHGVPIVDADKTDQWMLRRGPVIGDLSAKGKARQLIGRNGFVVDVNGARVTGA